MSTPATVTAPRPTLCDPAPLTFGPRFRGAPLNSSPPLSILRLAARACCSSGDSCFVFFFPFPIVWICRFQN